MPADQRCKDTFSSREVLLWAGIVVAGLGLVGYDLIARNQSDRLHRQPTPNRLEATVRDVDNDGREDVLITDHLQGRTYKFTIDKQGSPKAEFYETQKQ